MKRWTLKARLTLFYTTFLLLLTCTTLGILFSMSGRKVLASVKNQLENSVQKSVEEIEIEDGRLEVDNDFYSVEKGIYLSLYDESGYFLYGKVPYGIENAFSAAPEAPVISQEILANLSGNKLHPAKSK